LFDRLAIDFANRRVVFDMPENGAWTMQQNRIRSFRTPL
jgi:hypothetical protein